MPPFAAFFTPVDLLFHAARMKPAIGHRTAARCNRELGKRFGDNAYAVEELIAELTAAFTMAHLGLRTEPRADHAAVHRLMAEGLEELTSAPFSRRHQSATGSRLHDPGVRARRRRWQHDRAIPDLHSRGKRAR